MKEGLKIKIVADNKIPFLKGVLDQVADIVFLPGKEISAADVKEADALITRTRTCCDASLLDGSDVKFIATATIRLTPAFTAFSTALSEGSISLK